MCAVVLLVHAALWLLMFHTVEEDAFIYLRFAQNIADGWGYVFNIGGEHVESGTSVIWVGLLVACIKLQLSPILAMKLLGLIFSLLSIVMAGRLVLLLSGSHFARVVAMAILAVSYPQVYWSTQGLETPLIAFLLSACLVCILDTRWRGALPVVSAALVVARPEGIAYLSIVLAWGAWSRYRGDAVAWRQAWLASLIAALSLLAVTCWRIWYFGDFVIHPFYFKSGQLNSLNSLQLLIEANRRLRLDLLLAPVILAILMKRLPALAWPMAIAVALQMFWFASLRDHFPFERHLVAALPALYALSLVAVWSLTRNFSTAVQRSAFAAVSLIAALAIVGFPASPLYQQAAFFAQEPAGFSKAVIERVADVDALPLDRVDTFLRDQRETLSLGHNWETAPGRLIDAAYPVGSVIAYSEIGQTPFYAGSDKHFIDTIGLVTRDIGLYRFQQAFDERPFMGQLWRLRCAILEGVGRGSCHALDEAAAVDYVLNRAPDVIIGHSILVKMTDPKLPAVMVFKDPRFLQLYRERYVIDRFIKVYERRDRNFPLFEGDFPGVTIQRIP